MSAASRPRQPGWQPGHVPKLSYRRAIPPEEMDAIRRSDSCYQAQSRTENTGLVSNAPKESKQISIREIRKALPESRPVDKRTSNRELKFDSNRPAKKKGSLFTGLFAKEPTIVALAQVEADLVTKHGAATPQAVPHVSSRKLPQHVPKVNSKWDGLPDSLNNVYGRDEERSRWGTLSDSLSLEETIRSAVAGYRPRMERSSSSRISEGSRTRRPPFTYPESSSSSISGDLSGASEMETMSVRSQSLRSPSGRSLPAISCFFPPKQENPSRPDRDRQYSTVDSISKSPPSGQRSRRESEAGQQYYGPSPEAVPEHSSSPIATPDEASPVTPAFVNESLDAPAVRHAFLAGEARPLELPETQVNPDRWSDLPFRRQHSTSVARVQQDIENRPDSSRQRLGLRAIKVVGDEATPWTTHELQHTPTSPKSSSNQPKKWSKKFGLSRV